MKLVTCRARMIGPICPRELCCFLSGLMEGVSNDRAHFSLWQCFLEGSAFEDEEWGNIMLVFLGPDELHTIWGGLFGTHFYQILRTCAPRGKQKEMLLQLDRALAHAASTDKPTWLRLPSNRTHFSLSHNCSHREKAGVLQVIAKVSRSVVSILLPCLALVEPES